MDQFNTFKYLPQNVGSLTDNLIKNNIDFQVFELGNQNFEVPFIHSLLVLFFFSLLLIVNVQK